MLTNVEKKEKKVGPPIYAFFSFCYSTEYNQAKRKKEKNITRPVFKTSPLRCTDCEPVGGQLAVRQI